MYPSSISLGNNFILPLVCTSVDMLAIKDAGWFAVLETDHIVLPCASMLASAGGCSPSFRSPVAYMVPEVHLEL